MREESAPTGMERRKHPRKTVDWPVTLRLAEGEFEARLRDISRAGVCFYLDRRVPEMTILKMDLALPALKGRVVRAGGVVVRCQAVSPHLDHYEVAMFFNDISDDDREALTRMVDQA